LKQKLDRVFILCEADCIQQHHHDS